MQGKNPNIHEDGTSRKEIKTQEERQTLWKAVRTVKYVTSLPGKAVGPQPSEQEAQLATLVQKDGEEFPDGLPNFVL